MKNNLEELTQLQTPCYVFDEAACVDRVIRIRQEAGKWGGKLCFAIKANPFLIPALISVVDKFEVCSPGELEICRKYKVPGGKILFSGVVKTREDMENALAYPVDVITLESVHHWELLKDALKEGLSDETDRCVKVMPRLSSGAQFGMEPSQMEHILMEAADMKNIRVEGIHYFTGTQKKGKQYEKEIKRALQWMEELEKKFSLEDMILEYGPGLAVPYFNGDDFEQPYGLIENLRDFILAEKPSHRIDIELGRYLAASCGEYVTRIVDVKSADERNYCLVDGGIHQVNYYGSNMAMRTPVIEYISVENKRKSKMTNNTETEAVNEMKQMQEYMICGSLCTFADILARGVSLPSPEIGDCLVFENIGAYSVTEGSYLFLSHALPEIYIKQQNGQIRKVRSAQESWLINSVDDQV